MQAIETFSNDSNIIRYTLRKQNEIKFIISVFIAYIRLLPYANLTDMNEEDGTTSNILNAVWQEREWGREIERFERHSCQFPFDAIS